MVAVAAAIVLLAVAHAVLDPNETPFETLQPTRLRAVVLRVLANNMVPLQGVDQVRRNLDFTLRNEELPAVATCDEEGSCNWLSETNEMSEGLTAASANGMSIAHISRMWVVNRIYNETERLLVIKMLEDYDELYFEIPIQAEIVRRAVEPLDYIININGARNEAFREAVAMGADWAMVLDGNTYLTTEGWKQTVFALLRAENAGAPFSLIPVYRLYRPTVDESWLTAETSFKKIYETPGVIARGEAHALLRKNIPILLSETATYGRRDKLTYLRMIARRYGSKAICKVIGLRFQTELDSLQAERRIHRDCGYSYRLPYWPSQSRDEFDAIKRRSTTRNVARSLLVQLIGEEFPLWEATDEGPV
eukprot:Polyplicarium_translucidae@DN3120_c0_g1_i1.p3